MPARLSARALALVAVALAPLALATGVAHQPQKKGGVKTNSGTNEVYFGAHPAEWVCYDAPYKLTVHYVADEDLSVTVAFNGDKITPTSHDVAKGTGSVEFEIDYKDTVTDETLTAILYARGNINDVKATASRHDLCFLKGTMFAAKGVNPKESKRVPPIDLPEGAKEADMAGARKGKQVPAGFHYGEFTPRDKYVAGGQVRFWVQSRFKNRPPKMEYDRTATLIQQRVNGKWELKWFETLPKDLGEPKPPAGTSYIVIVALLDADGRVLEMRPHW